MVYYILVRAECARRVVLCTVAVAGRLREFDIDEARGDGTCGVWAGCWRVMVGRTCTRCLG